VLFPNDGVIGEIRVFRIFEKDEFYYGFFERIYRTKKVIHRK